jgi:desulfoferrodoxin (superoxide reductase-like protein)
MNLFLRAAAPALLFLLLASSPVLANKSAVTLEVPEHAAPGTAITIRVHVTHEGNNFFHYTDWVTVRANGTEIRRWEFSSTRRPESENFTVEMTYTVDGPVEITAQANCNVHGSEGPVSATVQVP